VGFIDICGRSLFSAASSGFSFSYALRALVFMQVQKDFHRGPRVHRRSQADYLAPFHPFGGKKGMRRHWNPIVAKDRPLTWLGWGLGGPIGGPLSPPDSAVPCSSRATSLAIVRCAEPLSHTIAHLSHTITAWWSLSPIRAPWCVMVWRRNMQLATLTRSIYQAPYTLHQHFHHRDGTSTPCIHLVMVVATVSHYIQVGSPPSLCFFLVKPRHGIHSLTLAGQVLIPSIYLFIIHTPVDRSLCIITLLYPVLSCVPPSSSSPAFWPSSQHQALPSVPCHHSNVPMPAAMSPQHQAVILSAAMPISRILPRAKQCRIA